MLQQDASRRTVSVDICKVTVRDEHWKDKVVKSLVLKGEGKCDERTGGSMSRGRL